MTEPTPSPWVATSGNWDIGLLEPLAEINERVLEALTAGAAGGAPSCSPLCQAPNIPWRTLGSEARQRLASCPFERTVRRSPEGWRACADMLICRPAARRAPRAVSARRCPR